jgi:hypothetical protein
MKEKTSVQQIVSLGDMVVRLSPHQGHANLEIFTTAEADQGPQYVRIFNLSSEELARLRDELSCFIEGIAADQARLSGPVETVEIERTSRRAR